MTARKAKEAREGSGRPRRAHRPMSAGKSAQMSVGVVDHGGLELMLLTVHQAAQLPAFRLTTAV